MESCAWNRQAADWKNSSRNLCGKRLPLRGRFWLGLLSAVRLWPSAHARSVLQMECYAWR